jgi:phage terminase large subunit
METALPQKTNSMDNPSTNQSEPRDILDFAAALGVNLYKWQAEILLTIEQAATLIRKKIAVRAPNGVGKTTRITALIALYWLIRNPRGKAVITSFDNRQIADQLWPALRALASKFPFLKFTDSEYTVTTPEGGRIRAFTTSDPGRAEGFHADKDCPLLVIVDEAKSIDPEIMKAVDRCSYNVLVYISSPGPMRGPFYEAFTANQESFITFAVGLVDCPHKPRELIDDIIATYGENDPYTRSTLYGEFMTHGDGVNHILELPDVEAWMDSSIGFVDGPIVFGCDFAAGGDDNVIVKRTGNAILKTSDVITWKEKNTANASGRFIRELRGMGYERGNKRMSVYGDATGIGKTMCDLIRESGIGIIDFNFGGRSTLKGYKNEGTRIWYAVAKMIRDSKIKAPNRHEENIKKLCAQLTSRQQKIDSSGSLWMETKEEMRGRGVKSPDVADAFCIAFAVQSALAYSYMPFDDQNRVEIARKHGWEYASDDDESYKDRRSWGSGGRGDDSGGLSGFGGVNGGDW